MAASVARKRPPVPILIESFPAPPTHIPPTPTTPNPPPTGPPSAPLPPVPGPSRISEHEQLLLLSSLSNRSRRSSKYSLNSRRESVVSLGSTGHGGTRSSIASNRDSVASSPHAPSSPQPRRQTPTEQLTRMCTSPMPQLSDIDDDDDEDAAGAILGQTFPRVQPTTPHRRHSRRPHRGANESLTDIDFRDILGAHMFDDDHQPPSSPSTHVRHLSSSSSPATPAASHPISHRTTASFSSTSTTKLHSPTMSNFSYPSGSIHSPISQLAASASPSSSTTTLVQKPLQSGHARRPGSIPSLTLPSSDAYSVSAPLQLEPSVSTMTQLSDTSRSSTTSSELTSSFDGETEASSFTSVSPIEPITTSPTIKDLRLEMRAGRTRSEGLKKALGTRSRSRSRMREAGASELVLPALMPPPPVPLPDVPTGVGVGFSVPEAAEKSTSEDLFKGIMVTKTTRVVKVEVVDGRGGEEMTLDEFGVLAGNKENVFPNTRSRRTVPAISSKPSKEEDPRSPSPDISTILSSTPRPSLSKSLNSKCNKSSELFSKSTSTPGPNARPRVRSVGIVRKRISGASSNDHANSRRRASEGPLSHKAAQSTELAYLQQREREMTVHRNEEFGIDGDEHDEALEKALEGEGSDDGCGAGEDSDSSLDLHTPLPNLMVRHGLLSPNSKLLPGVVSRSSTPMDERPGSKLSVVSNASVMTKSGVAKDERDTPMRRVRHRDGKLLRGGIGLTTGLGWSDSEDEDAPSPLTRRLSTLNLSRRSSASSILTTGTSASRRLHQQQHPLSRSYSSGALLESEHRKFDTSYDDDDLDDGDEDNTLQESADWARSRRPSGGKLSASVGARSAMPPPTSWHSRSAVAKRASGGSAGPRTSTSSAGSAFSLEVTIPEAEEGERVGRPPSSSSSTSRIGTRPGGRSSLGSSTGARDSSGSSAFDHPMMSSRYRRVTPTKKPSGDEVGTPSSTASTLSIPMPATPRDYDGLSSSTTPVKGSGLGMKFNKEKSLPPLPSGGLRRPSSRANLTANSNSKSTSNVKSTSSMANAKSTSTSPSNTIRSPSDGSSTKYAFPRARTFSSTSSASGVADGAGSPPRPLQLPRQVVSSRPAGDRAAVPVPSIPSALSLSSSSSRGALRTPSLTSARFATGYDSVPSSPLPPGMNTNSTPTAGTGMGTVRPKPRTGTGMVYRTSSASLGSKMRAPLVLASGSVAGGSAGGSGVASIGRAAGRPIVL